MAALILTRWAKRRLERMRELQFVSYINSDVEGNVNEANANDDHSIMVKIDRKLKI